MWLLCCHKAVDDTNTTDCKTQWVQVPSFIKSGTYANVKGAECFEMGLPQRAKQTSSLPVTEIYLLFMHKNHTGLNTSLSKYSGFAYESGTKTRWDPVIDSCGGIQRAQSVTKK